MASSSDSETSEVLVLKKKQKLKTKFNSEWCKTYLWLRKGKDDYNAHCTVCPSYFSVSHGGENDIKKHTNTATHKASVHQSASKMQKKVSSYFTSDGSIEQEKVISAEVSFVFHSVKCSHSYVSVDCCSRLFLQLFLDSKISEKYSCGRRKATKMISSMLGLYSEEQTIWQLSDSVYYSVSLDASNKGHIKTFPLVVHYFFHEEGVCTKLLSFLAVIVKRLIRLWQESKVS